MIDKILDVIKWGLILIIAGIVFYAVGPKYYFPIHKGILRGNNINGKLERYDKEKGLWIEVGKHESVWEMLKFLKEKSQ